MAKPAKRLLTDSAVQNLPAPEGGQVEIWDAKIPGFGVRVGHTGVKTFVMVYRFRGQWRRDTLGQYPKVKLADARGKAEVARADLREGRDPRDKRKTSRPAPKSESFGTIVDDFITRHSKRHNRPSSAAEIERLLKRSFVSVWDRHAITDITKRDVLDVLDSIMARNKPAAARHAFGAIRKFFNWCVERGILDDSPCRTIKAPAKHNSRDRVLSDVELNAVWSAAEEQAFPFGYVIQLLALTAQRRGEVCGMKWHELDLETKLWTIPGERTKNGKAHMVPLTDSAIRILGRIPRIHASEYVFPARGLPEKPYSGYSKGKRMLDATAELHDWTLHDLRRTAATGMAKLGVSPHVVERVLNHTTGTFGGVAGVYNRFQYLPEMRAALEQWEQHIHAIV